MKGKIAITALAIQSEAHPVVQALRGEGFDVVMHRGDAAPGAAELQALLDGAVGVIAGSEAHTRAILAGAPGLRVIARHGVGYDAIDLDAATELGVVVTYVPGAMTEAVADLTLGLLLAAARRISECDAAVKAGTWRRVMGSDIGGTTLGIVGTGRIGLAVARRAVAFGMRLLGFDPYPSQAFQELGGSYVPLNDLLSQSDYVSLHSPASQETRGLIGAPELARMRPGAFLLNCARGSLIDEEALLAALVAGSIAGAGLDVLSSEPPLPGSAGERIARHPKVVVTPHIASGTPATTALMGRDAAEDLRTVLRGDRPAYIANPAVWERRRR